MDPINVLSELLIKESSLTREEIELICSYFQQQTLNREDPLLKSGNKYKKIVFVVEGILRVFIVDPDGEEIVKNFIEPNSFFSSPDSFENNISSVINVSAVTDCKILTLSKSDADKLSCQLPKWEYLMKNGAMQAITVDSFTEYIRNILFIIQC
jgi:CRP/FNR family transcriptional regulator, anaerobic regulatory protein